MRHALLLCSALLALCACEGAATGEAPVTAADAAADLDARTPPPLDTGGPDAYVPAADDSFQPCPSHAECQSGFCVTDSDGARVCTRRCGGDSECPDAWVCRQVENTGVDVTFICVPRERPCDGADLASDPRHCGTCERACAYDGAEARCVDGECAPGPCRPGFHDLDGAPGCEYACTPTRDGVEACDEIDNDCDGVVDEGLLGTLEHCAACNRPCAPANADGACVAGECRLVACAAGAADLDGRPENGCEATGCAAEETCNGADDDCDGAVDEGFDLAGDPAHCGACGRACPTRNDEVACVAGDCVSVACEDGWVDLDGAPGCEYACRPADDGVEVCNDADDDCDGQTDEGFDLLADPAHCGACGRACAVEHALTVCRDGDCDVVACADGWVDRAGVCDYACTPTGDEACNGRDDDCDGRTDEGFDAVAEACNGRDDDCDGQTDEGFDAVPEACNGLDDDCDGVVDDGFDAIPEVCNGRDDDCDGVVDEGFDAIPEACNGRDDDCDGRTDEGFDAIPEACNGLDDDCDGVVDDGFALGADVANCGACGRVCALPDAIEACVAGECVPIGCDAGFVDLDRVAENGCECARGVERCNGADDDCDGEVDDGFDLRNDPAHCGACERRCAFDHATPVCLAGECVPGACDEGFVDLDGRPGNGCECRRADEVCNGLDDDCDGQTDDGFDLQNDPRHCGGCGVSCRAAQADTRCRNGDCELVACADGWVDANGDLADGCEVACALAPGTPGCGPAFVYDGTYDLAPAARYTCRDVIVGEVAFSLDVRALTFAVLGGALTVTGAPTALTQRPAPADGGFDARGSVPGGDFGCTETYSLTGQFTGANTWTALLQVQFSGAACGFTDCTPQAFRVTGTRR